MIKVNLLDARYTDKPKDKSAQGEINFKLVNKFNRAKEVEENLFKKYIINGAVFTPAVLATPIKSDPYNDIDLIVTKEEWEAMKSNKQYRIKNFELDSPIYRRMEICWTEQQVFGLDFDQGISEIDTLRRCKDLGLKPFWIYNSYSSTKENKKFRLLFKFEQSITDFRMAKFIQNGLMKMFPECDKQCSDLCRYFFGTNKKQYSLYVSHWKPDFSLTVEEFCIALFNYCKQKDRINYSRNIETFAENNYLLLDKHNCILLDKHPIDIEALNIPNIELVNQQGFYIPFVCKEMDLKYNGYKKVNVVKNGQTKTQFTKLEANYTEYKIDIDELRKKCKLVEEAYHANFDLGHVEYFKLMQLFSHIYGGDEDFASIIDNNYQVNKNNIDVYNPDSLWNEYTYIKYSGYNPPLCDGSCDEKRCIYADECQHGKTPLSLFNIKNSTIEKIEEDISNNDINTSYDILRNEMTKIYNSVPKHTIVNAPTGIGKTQITLDLIQPCDVLALPTHDLITDVYNRLISKGKQAIVARKRPLLADANDQKIYESYNNKSMDKQAQMFWKEKVKTYSINNSEQEANCIKWLDEQKELFECSDKIIICTHHKLPVLFKMNPHIKNVFIDEDPISNILITSTSIKMKDLEKFFSLCDWEQNILDPQLYTIIMDFKKELLNLKVLKPNIFHSIVQNKLSKEHRDEIFKLFQSNLNSFSSPVYELFEESNSKDANNFFNKKIIPIYGKKNIEELIIVNNNSLPSDKNIIILSASITKFMAQKFNIDYKEIDFNYDSDNIYLYYNETYSKSSLTRILKNGNNSLELNFIKNVIGNIPVITFKDIKDDLRKYGINTIKEMHFGKCEGFDTLKGQDIAIIGTFHSNPIAYEIIAAALDIDLSTKKMKNKIIFRNGYKYQGYFYNNDDLLEIQCYKIETNLIQAIGRARAYRNNAEVYVFSNYPIKGIKIMN